MAVLTIDGSNEHGLLVDGSWLNYSKWFQGEKPIVVKGDTVAVALDKAGKFIMSAVKVEASKDASVEDVGGSEGDIGDSSPSIIISDRIMFGQCVNLAFNSAVFHDADLEFRDGTYISNAFDLAERIYAEYSKRVKS